MKASTTSSSEKVPGSTSEAEKVGHLQVSAIDLTCGSGEDSRALQLGDSMIARGWNSLSGRTDLIGPRPQSQS